MAMASIVLLYFLMLVLLTFVVPVSVYRFGNALTLKAEATIGDVASVVLVLVTLCALSIAWYQLLGLSRQTRATILTALDERWEGAEIVDWRIVFGKFQQEVSRSKPAGLESRQAFADELSRLHDSKAQEDREKYVKLMRLAGFLEVLGYCVKAKYISLKDVCGLLEGAVVEADEVFGQYILGQREGLGEEGLYENYSWLVQRVAWRRQWIR